MGGWGWGGRGRRAGRAPGDGASNRRFRSGPGQQGAGGRTPSVPQPPIGRPLLRFRLRPVSRRRDRSAELPGSGRHFFFWGGGGGVRKPAFSRPSCSRPLRLVRLRPVPATVQARAFRQGPTGRRPWASPCYSAGEEGVAGAGRCPADTDAPPRPPPAPRAGTAALTEDADEATSAPSRAGWRRPWAGPTRNPPSSEPAVSTQKCAEGDQAGIRWRL